MSSTGSSKKPISERFCTSDHDVVLKASDGMHFHFYRKNLKVHSEGMLPTGDATEQSTAEPETISLEESSETIDLLLQFMLRQNQPTLQNVSFSAVLALAEAAEKYRVYSVVAPCQVHMREILPQNSLEILAYAGKHRHAELADLAAVPTIKSSLKAVVESLSTISLDLVVSWIRYRETWNDAFIHAQESLRMRFSQCYGGCRSAGTLSLHFKGQLGSLLGMDDIFVSVIQNDCRYCSPGLVAWKNEVMMTVKKLAAFSTHSKTWFANRIDGRALEDAHNEFDNVVIIQSCDNDFFRFSRDNLAVHSEGFEGASAISSSTSISAPETICLTESSATLRLLLQFMSSRPQPDLSKASFRDLANVSEAAEKYQVYAALPPCKAHMARALPQHPFPVMAYAARHGYMSLANEAAELVVAMPYEAILAKLASLPMDCGVAWSRYRERWMLTLDQVYSTLDALQLHNCNYSECKCPITGKIAMKLHGKCAMLQPSALDELSRYVTSLPKAARYGEPKHPEGVLCGKCQDIVVEWINATKEKVKGMKKFSAYV